MNDCIVGISGGHHASSAVLYKGQVVVGPVEGAPLNPHNLRIEDFQGRLDALVRTLAAESDFDSHYALLTSTTRAVFALPGVGTPTHRELALELIAGPCPEFRQNCEILDDTWAGLYAETQESRGICAFAGTGASVCVAVDEFEADKLYKIDGWGPVIGDHGSSFQLVTLFFQWLGREYDETGTAPPIFDEILDSIPKLESIDRVQRWFDLGYLHSGDEWCVEFAKVAAALTKLADGDTKGSEVARYLVQITAAGMARSIRIALRRVSHLQDMPIILQGGLFAKSKVYREAVVQGLPDERRQHVRSARFPPVCGALLYGAHDVPETRDAIYSALRDALGISE